MHEAGHALTALSVGATVVEMELYREQQKNYGRTRVDRTKVQACNIALGGFAAEYLLYKLGRLVKKDGVSPTESEFIDYAYRNASDDFDLFWEHFKELSDLEKLEMSQREMDKKFIEYAVSHAKKMSIKLVERLADELLVAGTLSKQDIDRIAALKQ